MVKIVSSLIYFSLLCKVDYYHFIYSHVIHSFTGNIEPKEWPGCCLAVNMRLHSSLGRASHHYGNGHGFTSRWSTGFFFQASISNCTNWWIPGKDRFATYSSLPCKQIMAIISYRLMSTFFDLAPLQNDNEQQNVFPSPKITSPLQAKNSKKRLN